MPDQKSTFGELRAQGCRRIYCSDHRWSHHTVMAADLWSDEMRLSDIEGRFSYRVCGRRGADIRPEFPQAKMGTDG